VHDYLQQLQLNKIKELETQDQQFEQLLKSMIILDFYLLKHEILIVGIVEEK
jgi:hypothetical protein